jgi:hypothetical protein
MYISKFFILESNRISLFLLPLLQHPIVPPASILHPPILILIHHDSLRLALLNQLILRLLVRCLKYPGIVFLDILQRLRDRARGLVAYPLLIDLCVESQEGLGLCDRRLYVVVLQVVLAAREDRVHGAA